MSRQRLLDPAHPYAHGDLWTPLALLFLHRLFTRGDWRSALGFSLFFSLEVLESLYALLSSAILVTVYGVYLAASNARRLRALAGKIAVAAALVAAVAWVVLAPYLETAATWRLPTRASSNFARLGQFALGQPCFPGLVALLLVLVALVDRARGRRPGRAHDPRLVFAVAGAIVLWSCTYGFRIPVLYVVVRSPLYTLRELVPGLSAVRVLAEVRGGVQLAVAFLAGYGVLVLVRRMPLRGRVATASALSMIALIELLHPGASRFSFGSPTELVPHLERPPEEDVELVRAVAGNRVLDLPYKMERDPATNSYFLLLAAFHQRPVAACYNSFRVPVQDQVAKLAASLPDPAASEALAALGFDTLFVHRQGMGTEKLARFENGIVFTRLLRGRASLEALETTDRIMAYRILPPESVDTRFDRLAAGKAPPTEARVRPPRATLAFAVANPRGSTFRHPDPIAPSALLVRWLGVDGEPRGESRTHALLPIAIGSDGAATVELDLPVQVPAGRYLVTLARAADPSLVLARQHVVVG